MINSILKRIKIKAYLMWGNAFGRVPFKDKFGVRYYLWPDYRLEDFVSRGVGVDDEGVFRQSINILSDLVKKRKKLCVLMSVLMLERHRYYFLNIWAPKGRCMLLSQRQRLLRDSKRMSG